MKLIHIILAVYVVFLDLRPCGDIDTCVDEQRAGISVTTVDKHNHSEEEQDLCTPFCICACCSSHVQVGYSSTIDSNRVGHNTKLTIPYNEGVLTNTHQSIWQPPRA
ncbi:MAG TPA: DUF6660 family protein [Cyclobacteriaceae bacterium]|nr:DUF6660 family protein [Cyclobacteriaceae bacterium]